MGSENLENMMFLKLNPHLLPEVKDTRVGIIRRTQSEGKVKAPKSRTADT